MGDAGARDGRPSVRRVAVLGAGLIGTSIALALRSHGVEVLLSDPDAAALRLACDLGAGEPLEGSGGRPADVAVIAAPPAVVPQVLRRAQDDGLAHVYTDAASVKANVVAAAEDLGCDLATFVPGHPMGGREKRGPGAARADLFLGRSWALCPTGKADPGAVERVAEVARLCGADPLVVDAAAHDRAVALVSHVPHLASSAVAARLLDAGEDALTLAGQGLRDVTRVAGGDPSLWTEILTHNAAPVARVLRAVAEDLSRTADALAGPDMEAGPVRDLLVRGRDGHGRIPGKHGEPTLPDYTVIPVVIPDEPGTLGRLFAAAADAGVNIEDVRIEHTPGLPLGVAQLYVLPAGVDTLSRALAADGWSVHPGA
ncbi:prephenate dehydrogenase [Nocardiopsis changdeensis]|uniref:Prephenate dehydrogenase n=1 Tax=Nocardiopsis changdeensis TaxID=2831969 RepID=A0ABX8BVM1_9ACTN|nr:MULTISPECIES: prephenate dehydrogenase [Nocardiopsis]QUX26146.1 prephenate dehydrogenase [Nocardiopsis changdeensis]QYX40624.1 prephenate dehydrogenase [Nocardiopsis sp. MT53]